MSWVNDWEWVIWTMYPSSCQDQLTPSWTGWDVLIAQLVVYLKEGVNWEVDIQYSTFISQDDTFLGLFMVAVILL